MSDNTLQYDWIVRLKGGLELACPGAFVAGDLLWYYAEGDPTRRVAPDVLVAFGRAPGHRGSYLQWLEGGVCPQVVVEVWSPGNTFGEQVQKLRLYERLGVVEFITYDPDRNTFVAFERNAAGSLEIVAATEPWVSPLTGARFVPGEPSLRVYGPDGEPFRNILEAEQHARDLAVLAETNAARADENAARADENAARADENAARADENAARVARLAEKLKALGIDPDV
jgi:hypothetical protein